MSLDPQLKPIIAAIKAAFPGPIEKTTPAALRARLNERTIASMRPRLPEIQIEDGTLPGGIRVRLYRHQNAKVPMPALVYLHGGGWVVGSIDTSDAIAAAFARDLAGLVVSVDYRLAPEHPFPIGLEDCYAATAWVAAEAKTLGVDLDRVAVGGDSAGGNLAAAVAILARDRNGPKIAFQLLNYPVTDCNLNTLSHIELADEYLPRRSTMAWYWQQYVGGDGFTQNALASLLLQENLSGLPPALVTAAECDCLRDEVACYAAKLAHAGVPTTYRLAPGMSHGFLEFIYDVDAARKEYEMIAAALCLALQQSQSSQPIDPGVPTRP